MEEGIITSIRRVKPDDFKYLQGPLADFSHCTILPGLVDCHVHLTMSGTNDPEIRRHQLNYTFDQAGRTIAEHLSCHLNHGIVAVRDGGDSAGHSLRYRQDGQLPECFPGFVKSAGKAWRAKGRYGRLIGRAPQEGRSLSECITEDESRPDHIKIINSGLNSLEELGKETLPQFEPRELDAAVQAGRRKLLKCMVHANGKVPVRHAVDAGCHSIEHGFFMGHENIERMADLQVFWVPTAITMKAYSEELAKDSLQSDISRRTLDHQLEQIAYARHLGVPIAVGTDSGSLGVHHGASYPRELELLMSAGFSTEEAVSCASLEGARLLGLKNELGQVRKGLPATFVVVEGPPSHLPRSLATPVAIYVGGTITTTSVRNIRVK
jgi:imidazolonepropionase-like amidohydrolase